MLKMKVQGSVGHAYLLLILGLVWQRVEAMTAKEVYDMQECVSDFIADCNKDVNVCTAMAMSKCLPVLEENEGKCEIGEIYRCGGCEKSCDNLRPTCHFDCQMGCYCDEGFVRNADGVCDFIENCSNAANQPPQNEKTK